MRKLIFTTALILLCSIISAQTERGKFLVGGGSDLNAYFSSYKYDNGTTSGTTNYAGFNLDLRVGYFVVRNLVIGENGTFDYTHYKYKDTNNESTNTDLSIGPFIRYYFGQSKVKPFIDTHIEWMMSNSKYSSGTSNTNDKYTGFAFGAGFGLAFFVNDRVGLNGIIGYTGRALVNVDHTNDTNSGNNVSFNIGITVSL